jgi:hypothetical protein
MKIDRLVIMKAKETLARQAQQKPEQETEQNYPQARLTWEPSGWIKPPTKAQLMARVSARRARKPSGHRTVFGWEPDMGRSASIVDRTGKAAAAKPHCVAGSA